MQSPRHSRRTPRAPVRAAMPAVALALALLAGGCAASDKGPAYVAGPIPFPGDLPPLPPQPIHQARVEIEADGLPAQLAPRNRRAEPDDPSEPWSPNYGQARGVPVKAALTAMPATATPAEPARAIASGMQAQSGPIDADDIIRRAIAEHEMRHR